MKHLQGLNYQPRAGYHGFQACPAGVADGLAAPHPLTWRIFFVMNLPLLCVT